MIGLMGLALACILLIMGGYCQSDTLEYLEDMWSVYPSGQNINWPSTLVETNYINSGQYYPINILPTRFQMAEDHVFILTPRYRLGVPSSVNKFRLSSSKGLVKLEPWPCLEVNAISETDGIINAVDLTLDRDGILWFLDLGEINTLGPPQYNFYPFPPALSSPLPAAREPPRILGFSIYNFSLEYRFELWSLISEESKLQFIQVEVADGDKFVYVADAGTRSLLMFETCSGRGYKVLLPSMLGGEPAQDVLYMVLIQGPPLLLLTYLSSSQLFALPTERLRNRRVGELAVVGTKPGPIVLLGADNERRLFFRMRGEGNVFVWNVDESFSSTNFHLVRSSRNRRGTHVAPGHLSLVWLLESNFQDFVRGTAGCLGPSAKLLPLINQTILEEQPT